PRRGLACQVGCYQCLGLIEPEDAVRHCAHQPHPDVEEVGRDLVAVVEAAEDETLLPQTALATRRVALRNLTLVVITLVTVRQVHYLFAEEGLLLGRHNKPIP